MSVKLTVLVSVSYTDIMHSLALSCFKIQPTQDRPNVLVEHCLNQYKAENCQLSFQKYIFGLNTTKRTVITACAVCLTYER